ncbi:MAG: hypothetical protein Fur0011_2010 [Candidatus Microgenomates bacterium]
MKKILPILLVGALLAGGVYYYQSSRPTNAPQTILEQTSEAAQWAAAIASGRPTLCTVTKGEEEMDYLIMGKKMKTTIVTMVDTQKMTSHMLNDEKYLYMWEEGKAIGTKMAIPTEEETKQMVDTAKEYSKNMPDKPNFESESGFDSLKNEGYTINCDGSSATDADFIPPATVKFTDLSVMTKAIPTPNEVGEYDMKDLEEIAKKYQNLNINE